MTWIPCGYCHSCPCVCTWRYQPPPVQYVPVPTTTTWTLGPSQSGRLSDEDVDRIAKRVLELQGKLLAGVRALHDLVDQTDPNDPIGVALTKAGLERRP